MDNSSAPIHPELKEALDIVNQPDPYEENSKGLSVKGEQPLIKSNKSILYEAVKRGWDTFHRYGLWLLVFCSIGIYIGITASKMYFSTKMDDAVKVGGMVFKEKVYVILAK